MSRFRYSHGLGLRSALNAKAQRRQGAMIGMQALRPCDFALNKCTLLLHLAVQNPRHGVNDFSYKIISYFVYNEIQSSVYQRAYNRLINAIGACPRIRMCRAHRACGARSRREEEAMRGHRLRRQRSRWAAARTQTSQPHAPKGFRRRVGICCVGAPRQYPRIACVAPPCICPRGARNAAYPNSRTGS